MAAATADPAQLRRDVYLGLLVVAGALLNLLLVNSVGVFGFGRPPRWPEQVAWTVAVALPMLWRRRFPEVVAVVIAVVFIGAQIRHNPENLVSSIALFMVIYAAGGRRRVPGPGPAADPGHDGDGGRVNPTRRADGAPVRPIRIVIADDWPRPGR